jgi:DNA-binding transcriptional ArsR family regulator
MIYLNGHLARPLDAALSCGSRVAVLRVLKGAGELGKSGREVARSAGINHQAAAQALAALKDLGLLERRAWGAKVLWRLDRRRWLVSEVLLPMLKNEAAHADGVVAEIKTRLKDKCRAALLTGDAARGGGRREAKGTRRGPPRLESRAGGALGDRTGRAHRLRAGRRDDRRAGRGLAAASRRGAGLRQFVTTRHT